MNDDSVVLLMFVIILGVGGFFVGRATGDDYWHKQCDSYSISAYALKEVPGRCIK